MISPVPGGARRRSRVAGMMGLLAAAGLLTVAAQEATAQAAAPTPGSFTTVSAPFTSSNDYITNLPGCVPSGDKELGPMGVLYAGGRFFVTDNCNFTTYSYTPGTTTATLHKSLQNGLTIGLALDNGVYYGIAGGSHIVSNGVYTFDPETLALGKEVVPIPCNGDPRDLATDPSTGDLFLTTKCGLYRITGLDTDHPTTKQIGDLGPNLDGIEVVDGGKHVWVATVGASVDEYDTTSGDIVHTVPLPGAPDGLALAGPSAPGGIAGNLFVNSNDGTITMIDVHDGFKTSVVASGGSRGDFVTIGPDGVLYATQSDSVVQLHPGFFVQNPTAGSPTSPTSSSSSSPSSSPSTSKSSSSSPSSSPSTSGSSSSSSSGPSTTPTGTPTTAATTEATGVPTDEDTGTGLPRTGADLGLPLLLTGVAALLLGTLIVLWTRRQRALNAGDHE